jgi:YHS domain-containing protein/phenylpyruvate tautomerase PptA (4-oxalocrotonate tautomerase family)
MSMTFIELFAPAGTLDDRKRRHLGDRLVTELIRADGAPPEIIERGRELTWLVVHEPEVWTVGARQVGPGDAPRYVVRVSVPGGHLNDGMRAELVERLTGVIAEVEDDPHRVYEQPDAWVHVNEVPSGHMGAFGQIVTTADITRMAVTGERPDPAPSGPVTGGPTAEEAIDPICGMTVVLDAEAVTLDVDGSTYGFCSPTCRDLFDGQDAARSGVPEG